MNLIPIDEVVKITGFKKATINTYRYKEDTTFPKPTMMIDKVAHWDEPEVIKWSNDYADRRKYEAVIVSEKAIELFDEGKTPLQIARYFNTTESRVIDRFNRLGIDYHANQKILPLYGRECVKPDFRSDIFKFTLNTIARASK